MYNKQLIKKGWVEFEGISSSEQLIALAEEIGCVIPHPDGRVMNALTPKDGGQSLTGTFSNRYGFGGFPLHTDTAFWAKPARYIVMGAFQKSECDTFVVSAATIINNLSKKARNAVKTAIYLIKTPAGQHYTSVLFSEAGNDGFKYDPCCMHPVNNDAKYFNNEFIKLLDMVKTNSIHWTGNKAIVLDNWKVMHGRKAILDHRKSRELFRIYVR